VAAPLAVIVSILIAGLIVVQDWRDIEVRSAGWLVASSLVGIPLGLLLLTLVSDHIVKAILGIIIAGFATYSLLANGDRHLERDRLTLLLGTGFVSGILGGAYGMNGPPLAIYGSLRRWNPQRFRATLQGYFLIASVAGLVGYATVGLLRPPLGRYLLLSLPGVFVGVVVGRVLNRRLKGGAFYRVVYGGLILIGCVLVAQSTRGGR